ncbi:MAG: L-threonylcarbamoyladenylate synthase, partial [Actinomycetes bacterium]
MSALITTDVDEAAAALRNGGLVAFPTETVYGLGAAADNPEAVRRIFAVKARPADHPVIVHVAYSASDDVVDALEGWADQVPEYARLLVAKYWPGPLTVVLHRKAGVGEVTAGGHPTIAVRSPSHPMAQALLEAFGGAIAAPSANRFGRVSPTTAAHVVSELAEVLDPVTDRILDGGPCDVGVESTIVDCTGPAPRLLRSGSVTVEDIESVTGKAVLDADPSVRAPGTLAAHYAPSASVIVVDESGLDAVVASHQAS